MYGIIDSMKKKLALIIISIDECFTKEGFSGGGHKVTKNLISGFLDSGLFEIDIFCKKGNVENLPKIEGINSIQILGKKNFQENLEKIIDEKDYDYVFSSDVLLPFANNLIHSNSSKFKSKNGKSPLMQKLAEFYNHSKIKKQENNISREKTTFTVSQSLKDDYVESFGLDKNKVFVAHPAIDETLEFSAPEKRETFTIGSIAGGGLNVWFNVSVT